MKKILIALAVAALGIFALAAYSGLFHSVTVTEKEIGPYTMILKAHRGSYFGTGEVFKEVAGALKPRVDPESLLAVGIYYDDPARVPEAELRSECGFIVEKSDLEKIGVLSDAFIVKAFPKTNCAAGEFPLRTPLGYMLGPSRAYPKLAEYVREKNYRTEYGMEIYDMRSKRITYCMPIIKK